MEARDVRKKFIEFFENKGHTIVPSSSLIPEDSSVLLTTAGMQQFKNYYLNLDPQKVIHSSLGKPVGLNAASIQKCFRTSDIDEVGDETHLTFFEMLGNFSFGGYFKKEAIEMAYEFITSPKWMNLKISYVTVFDPQFVKDDDWRKNVPFDEETYNIWKNEIGLKEDEIKKEGVDVFWGPTGKDGPCGPTTEIYVKNALGKDVEIWNLVFNQYFRDENFKLTPLNKNGVDTGMGLERLVMVLQNKKDIFETDLFSSFMNFLKEKYEGKSLDIKDARIMVDHLRGIAFLISDGVLPSNKDTGYVLRRILRRFIAKEYLYLGETTYFYDLLQILIKDYQYFYPELNFELIKNVFEEERNKFLKTIKKGINVLNSLKEIDASSAFKVFESYGIPFEVIKEIGGVKAKDLKREDFEKEFEKHREVSKRGAEKKFGGHGLILDTRELKASNDEELKKVVRLHTATHLLHQALRLVLGEEVRQMGSDITPERTRFDFSFPRKLTAEEIKKVEDIVNDIINKDYEVKFKEMKKEEAEKTGALHFFNAKYPPLVKVYYIGPHGCDVKDAWSKEFCGGPHVEHTKEIGNFKIIKEESVSAGVRRIRAIVE
jgi:alanyl-tRNA synthetase